MFFCYFGVKYRESQFYHPTMLSSAYAIMTTVSWVHSQITLSDGTSPQVQVMLVRRKGNIATVHVNGSQRYEQFLQVGQLYPALVLIGLTL